MNNGCITPEQTEPTLTLSEMELCANDRERYQGFGAVRTCTEWARKLGISRVAFWCHLHKDGLTVEDIFAKYGRPTGKKERKERTDTHKAKTREMIYYLLLGSGYLVSEDDIQVEYGKKTNLLIKLYGEPLGEYDYADDTLKLPSGQGLKLLDPWVDEQMIRKDRNGRWDVHPKTRAKIVEQILDNMPGIQSEDEYRNL